jgi:hypothetical protein
MPQQLVQHAEIGRHLIEKIASGAKKTIAIHGFMKQRDDCGYFVQMILDHLTFRMVLDDRAISIFIFTCSFVRNGNDFERHGSASHSKAATPESEVVHGFISDDGADVRFPRQFFRRMRPPTPRGPQQRPE